MEGFRSRAEEKRAGAGRRDSGAPDGGKPRPGGGIWEQERRRNGMDGKKLYNILLVDDETDVLEVMKKKVNWEELGFFVAGTAENGQEAMELAEQIHVDVVLTDINMPFMDGLTLCRKIKENDRSIRVVIYSGYDEFEYAREAIHLEAEEYLLKPISAKDLEQVFGKIRASLDGEMAQRRDMDRLYEYYQRSLPQMQEQVVISILEGRVSRERAMSLMRMYEMDLESNCYVAAVLQGSFPSGGEQFQLYTLSLMDLVRDYLKDAPVHCCVNYLNQIVVIFLLERKEELERVLYDLEQIVRMANRMLEGRTTAAVGQTVEDLMEVTVSYKEAENAMEYRAVLGGENRIIYINDIEPRPQASVMTQEYDYQEIVRAVKLGEREEVSQAVHQFIGKLKILAATPGQYQIACVELLTEFIKIGRSYKLHIREIFGSDRVPWQEIDRFSSVEELENWLLEICNSLRRTLRSQRKDSTARMTEEAKAYIEAHYRESDLSADRLCRHLGVSNAYFSTVFKREVGEGFAAYLTRIRLEHALELLAATEDKTYIIAEAVGYTEPNYFSYVFKKQYGVSPTRYRANRKAAGKPEGAGKTGESEKTGTPEK